MPLVIKSLLDSVCWAKPKDLCSNMAAIHKKGKIAWFKDNHSSILAVAHLDTVNPTGLRWSGQIQLDKNVFFSPYVDDRLGAYTILKVLPQAYDINPDILFTMDEESGSSTASLFKTEKKYNWIVEFDRRGEDVVMYDFKDEDLVKKLEGVGFATGFGSMSDICKLDGLGCKAFNVGVGYEQEHSSRPFFVVPTYESQIAKFVAFYELYKDVLMPHTKTKKNEFYQWGQGKISGFGMGRTRYYGNPSLMPFHSGVSDEYEDWSAERDRRDDKDKSKPVMIDTTKSGWSEEAGICPHLWCPVCAGKLVEGKCRQCGELVCTSEGWWPKVLVEN